MRTPLASPARRSMARAIVTAALLVVAGCVPQGVPPAPMPTITPAPPPRATSARPVAADWRDRPLTPGTWTWRRDDRGSLALFGPAGSDALLSLRCDLNRRQVLLSRAGSIAGPLTIRTTSLTRVVPVQPTGGTPAYVAAALAPHDSLLDAMGFSRGRFVVEAAGSATLVVPAWAEIERVTEDCRD